MHLLWKQDFPVEINEKFCLKKDKFYLCSGHVFHDVWAMISKVLLNGMGTCTRSPFYPFPFLQNSPFVEGDFLCTKLKRQLYHLTGSRIRRGEENKWKENEEKIVCRHFLKWGLDSRRAIFKNFLWSLFSRCEQCLK